VGRNALSGGAVRHVVVHVWSHVDYEDLIAEILVGGELLALVSEERGPALIDVEIFPRSDGAPWKLTLDELRAAIDGGAARLREMTRIEE